MSSKHGVEETKDVIIAVNRLALFLVSRLKDGAGWDDALAFYQAITGEEEFKKIVVEAYEGIQAVPAEVKDLDVNEIVQLLLEQINFVPLIIEEIKK